jgi:YebC/PmpR family DNA-binding regulatory protein
VGRWMAIKNRKASADAKKGVNLAKYSHEIIRASKLGGPDPTGNFRLRTAIERAKAGGLAKTNIESAVARGQGLGDGDQVEELTYEGYGPGGVAILVEASTDNRNRTAGDIRSYFNKCDGNLGQDGCVAYLFQEVGVVTVAKTPGSTLDQWFDVAAECGGEDVLDGESDEALDIEGADDGQPTWQLVTPPNDLNQVCMALAQYQPTATVLSAEFTRIPQTKAAITQEGQAKALFKLLGLLEQHDDVQAVYSNEDVDEALLDMM